jgi:glycosyltransferase involved in cell wall biosynthesis
VTQSRISVVTPSFNMAAYLEETIVSVIGNLKPGDEYFIIDGGSTDGSVDIIRKYEDRITGWVSEGDRGYADAIGKGFDRASGDILCWINAGDLYLKGALDAARAGLGDSDMIFGDDFHIDETSRVLSYSHGRVRDLRAAMLFGGWTPLQDACFWRREFYEKIGGIDRSLLFAADYDLFLRMALTGNCRYVPLTFSAFRRHPGQKSLAGAAAYRAEREAARRRERVLRSSAGLNNMSARLSGRVSMSMRARLSHFLWRRADLRGVPVASLVSGRYWPALRSEMS